MFCLYHCLLEEENLCCISIPRAVKIKRLRAIITLNVWFIPLSVISVALIVVSKSIVAGFISFALVWSCLHSRQWQLNRNQMLGNLKNIFVNVTSKFLVRAIINRCCDQTDPTINRKAGHVDHIYCNQSKIFSRFAV